jgi:WD repeat-containing protein 23
MGYGMSRLEDEYYEPEGQDTDGSSSDQVNDEFSKLHNDIFHMTRMRSGLSESIYKSVGANRGIISTAKLLSGREVGCSGKGMFSSGDRAFVLGRYVPVNGPELLDRMDSRAYVSQFSADGTLFVAGFQVCYAQPTNNESFTKFELANFLQFILLFSCHHFMHFIKRKKLWKPYDISFSL